MPKRQTKNMYWPSKIMDGHIVHYNTITDEVERNAYYEANLHIPLQKLVECVVNRFKFQYTEFNVDDLKRDTLTHLTLNLHNFKGSKGKAFGYLSVAAKNYIMQLSITGYRKQMEHVSMNLNPHKAGHKELEETLSLKESVAAGFCDEHFLSQLIAYFNRTQLAVDDKYFFNVKYNCILHEMLKILSSPEQYATFQGKKQMNRLIRKNAPVADFDNKPVAERYTASYYNKVILRIKKVCCAAYEHYLQNGNLNELNLVNTNLTMCLLPPVKEDGEPAPLAS